jgi:diacylglycerol kinase (ATP)
MNNQMLHFLQSRINSFRNAFAGLGYVLRTQRNAWIHALATALVFIFATWLDITIQDWTILILTIGTVWTAEFINTALEAVVDLASPHQHYLARVGKDVGAAAVLIAAISSALIGLLILGPPFFDQVSRLLQLSF